MQEAAKRLAGKGAVVQVNTDENPALAARFDVRGIPALHLLRGGKPVATLAGASDIETLLAWFNRQRPE